MTLMAPCEFHRSTSHSVRQTIPVNMYLSVGGGGLRACQYSAATSVLKTSAAWTCGGPCTSSETKDCMTVSLHGVATATYHCLIYL